MILRGDASSSVQRLDSASSFAAPQSTSRRRPHAVPAWSVERSGFAASSVDSGRTWRRRDVHVTANMVPVLFVSTTVGWMGAEPATLLCTRDGGRTWDEQGRIASEPMAAFIFVDRDVGWIVGSSGSILATSDGGTTWITQRSGKGTKSALADVRFIDGLHGWAVGDDLVLRTTDGGSSWKLQAVTVSAIWTRIFFRGCDAWRDRRRALFHPPYGRWRGDLDAASRSSPTNRSWRSLHPASHP